MADEKKAPPADDTVTTPRQREDCQAEIERLASIGRFTSKIAHELNSPLDGILRYVNLALRSVEQQNFDRLNEYLSQSRKGLMRMAQIVGELLEFSRARYGVAEEPVALEQVIEDAIRITTARPNVPDVRIARNFAPELPSIRPTNLTQVFCNLINNAFDAMPDGGELTISARADSDSATVIEFRDTGCGFDPEHVQAIFEPFFTTKDRGKGTGLGLAICKDIIERRNGRITAENNPQGGSIFTVYLPASPQVN